MKDDLRMITLNMIKSIKFTYIEDHFLFIHESSGSTIKIKNLTFM